MTTLARLAVGSALIVACSIRPVAAEPILAVYHVQVSERMTWESNPIGEPFFQEFTLLMGFDPALGGDRTYGPVSFSEVPLPDVPAPGEVATNSSTAHGQFDEPIRRKQSVRFGRREPDRYGGRELFQDDAPHLECRGRFHAGVLA